MNREKSLETILVLVIALGVCYWIFRDNHSAKYFLYGAGLLGLIGLFIPSLAARVHWLWMKLAEGLGFVMSKVLLTTIYCVVLLPLSFLSKIFRKKSTVRLEKDGVSYFTDRNYTYNKESMENVW